MAGSTIRGIDRMVLALQVELTATVVSFRDPLYAGVQVGLPCPPPATVGGMLAAAAGGWTHVHPGMRFAMAFRARGTGVDLETYHPLDATGKPTDATPKDRDFLAAVTLTVWLTSDVHDWHAVLRRPVWPLRLGRSQDLVSAPSLQRIELATGPGRQGCAVVPADRSAVGTLLRLPTSISHDRARTRWDPYRHHGRGSEAELNDALVTPDGQAVLLLPPTHPDQFAEAST